MRPRFRITAVLIAVAVVATVCMELKRRNTRLVLTGVVADVRHSNEGFNVCTWNMGIPSVATFFNDCCIPDYLVGIGYPISIEIDGQDVGLDAIEEIEAHETLERLVITNSSFDGVLDLNRFSILEHLSFEGSGIRNVTFPLGGGQLRSFNAAGTGVDDDDIGFLLKCTTLKAIDLSGTKVSPHFLKCLKDRCNTLCVLKGPSGLVLDSCSCFGQTENHDPKLRGNGPKLWSVQ
jgi:hypothetical protein